MLVTVKQWALVDVEFDEVIEIYPPDEDPYFDEEAYVYGEVSPGSVKLMEVTITWNN